MSVTVCKRNPSAGRITLFLSYNPPVRSLKTGNAVSEEDLPIFVYEKPSDGRQITFNTMSLERAENICDARRRSIERGEIKLYQSEIELVEFYKSIVINQKHNYTAAFEEFKRFAGNNVPFKNVTKEFVASYREYLLDGPITKRKMPLEHNTAHNYFNQFRFVLGKAFEAEYTEENLRESVEPIGLITECPTRLSDSDLRKLISTPCIYEEIPRICCFILLTGLRVSEVTSLRWENISTGGDRPYINRTLQRTHRTESYYISKEALSYLGTPMKEGRVFPHLGYGARNERLQSWILAARVTKKVTFEDFRRSLYTLKCYY